MSDRVLVGASFSDTPLVLFGGGTAAAAGMAFYKAGFPLGNGAFLWLPAAVLLLIFLARLAHILRNRRWISPTPDGLVLETRRTQVFVADHQIADLAFTSRVRYDNGRPVGTRARGQFLIGTESAPVRFPFRHDVPFGESDALAGAFERILTGLADRAGAELPSRPLAGEGWEYDPAGMSFGNGQGRRLLAPEDVAAVDLIEEKVCVWAAGEPMPCLRVPADSPGALVLARLLRRELRDRPKADDPTEGLGRVLFERGRGGAKLGRAALALLAGMWLAALASWAAGSPTATATSVVLGVIISPLCIVAWVTESKLFRCCQRGVYQRTVWGTAELRYEDVGSFTYAATRYYVNGAYSGTDLAMRFRPRNREAGRSIRFKARVNGGDEELDNLRQHIARVIADRMHRRLANGKAVEWTPDICFRPAGLEITARVGLFRRLEVWVLPYGEVTGIDLQDGVFYLFEAGRKGPVFQTPVSVRNFFPGFELLQRVLAGSCSERSLTK